MSDQTTTEHTKDTERKDFEEPEAVAMGVYFEMLVRDGITLARTAHPKPIHSLHEGYAVLLEEVQEFWAEVMKQDRDRDSTSLMVELVQVAVVARRIAEDVIDRMVDLSDSPLSGSAASAANSGGQA